MNRMKCLSLSKIGNISFEEREIPQLSKDMVLVKIKKCGICSSDIERVYKTGTYHFPTVPGHEFSGTIVNVYSESDNDLIGKNVSVFPLIPCFDCESCMNKKYVQCSNYNYFGSRCDGGFSEYIAVPKWNLVFIGDIPFEIASMCEPTAVAFHAFHKVSIKSGDLVAIIGTGTIAFLLAMICEQFGIRAVICGRNSEKISFAKELGLKSFNVSSSNYEKKFRAEYDGHVDYCFEIVGTNEALDEAITLVDDFGKIVIVGNPKGDMNILKASYWRLLRKEITVVGTWNSSYKDNIDNWQEALSFFKSCNYDLKKLITKEFRLCDGDKAFHYLMNRENKCIKVMYDCEGNYNE